MGWHRHPDFFIAKIEDELGDRIYLAMNAADGSVYCIRRLHIDTDVEEKHLFHLYKDVPRPKFAGAAHSQTQGTEARHVRDQDEPSS